MIARQTRARLADPGLGDDDDDLVLVPVLVRAAAWLRVETNRWASKLIIAAGVAFAAYTWFVNERRLFEPPAREAAEAPATPSGAAPTAYELELSTIVRRYPQLNPESALYDQQLVGAMKVRSAELQRQGDPPELALRRAVAQVMERRDPVRAEPPREKRNPNARDAYPDCVYKSVMSDADYRACGARPPGAR